MLCSVGVINPFNKTTFFLFPDNAVKSSGVCLSLLTKVHVRLLQVSRFDGRLGFSSFHGNLAMYVPSGAWEIHVF